MQDYSAILALGITTTPVIVDDGLSDTPTIVGEIRDQVLLEIEEDPGEIIETIFEQAGNLTNILGIEDLELDPGIYRVSFQISEIVRANQTEDGSLVESQSEPENVECSPISWPMSDENSKLVVT